MSDKTAEQEFTANHFVDGPFFDFDLRSLKNAGSASYGDDDADEDLDQEGPPVEQEQVEKASPAKLGLYHRTYRMRVVARGNWGESDYRVELQVVEMLRSKVAEDYNARDPRKVETIMSAYVFPDKQGMSYASSSDEIEAMRKKFKDLKEIEKLLVHLDIPSELMESFRNKVNPYKKVATAMVTYETSTSASVLFMKKSGENGEELLALPEAPIEGGINADHTLSRVFLRECKLRLEKIRPLKRMVDNDLRVVFQGAVASLTPESYAYALSYNSAVVLVQKDKIADDPRITPQSKQYLAWIDAGVDAIEARGRRAAASRAETMAAKQDDGNGTAVLQPSVDHMSNEPR